MIFGLLLAILVPSGLPLTNVLVALLTAGARSTRSGCASTAAPALADQRAADRVHRRVRAGPERVGAGRGLDVRLAIAAKRLARTRREHIFNPAALALLWAPIAFASGESWWGALGDLPAVWSIVLVVVGGFLVERLNKFPAGADVPGHVLRPVHGGVAAASARWPRCSARRFIQAALFLAFFMLTDPPTSPNQYGDQILAASLAAAAACLRNCSARVRSLAGRGAGCQRALAGCGWRRKRDAPRGPRGWQALTTE